MTTTETILIDVTHLKGMWLAWMPTFALSAFSSLRTSSIIEVI
jgi:hypothetical protein